MHKISQRQRDSMIIAALIRDGLKIRPCGGRRFSECYTVEGDCAIFWYNIGPDTHVITQDYQPPT